MKRSALFHIHRRSGAQFGEYFGWQLPASFASPEAEAAHARSQVALADISFRAKYESVRQPERHWWRLRDDRFLTIGDPPLDSPADAIDVTSVYTNLLLAGPFSCHVLAKVTSLNTSAERLPNLANAQASVAHVHTIVLREDLGGIPAYHLLVTRDYAESFWMAILHAGHEFGMQPLGIEAVKELRG